MPFDVAGWVAICSANRPAELQQVLERGPPLNVNVMVDLVDVVGGYAVVCRVDTNVLGPGFAIPR
jgi:hypothetical protein